MPLLESFCRAHRAALFVLLETLVLEATSADASVVNAVNFIRACRKRTGEYVPETLTVASEDGTLQTLALDLDSFATGAWKKVIRVKKHPGKLARRHLEVSVFSFLATELRSGDIAVVGADSYAGLHRQMMTWQQCRDLAEDFCSQTGIPATGRGLVERFKAQLADTARAADADYPANTDLVLEGDRPLLKRRKGADRRPSAISLEAVVHERLGERGFLDIITTSAHRLGWHKHFGPASGSDPKLRDALGRYCLTVFTYGTLLGPAQVARHMEGTVSAHELYTAGNKHTTAEKITRASAEVINAFAQLDVASVWGDGRTVAADGTQVDSWENNLLAESYIRYGGYGGIAYRHVSDTYIALFSHFIPCGVWEAVYIIEGLLQNESELQPTTIHADTQGQSLPVFGLAALLGFDLLPRIRDRKDLNLYRPDTTTRYTHIDPLFGDAAIDWALIEIADRDGLTAVSIRKVAAGIGAGAASLYRYLKSHDELIELIVDTVSAEYDLAASDEPPTIQLLNLARQGRAIMYRHPWLAPLLLTRPSMGPNSLGYPERALSALKPVGLPGPAKLQTVAMMTAITSAFVQNELASADSSGAEPDGLNARVLYLADVVQPGNYPLLAGALTGQHDSETPEEMFTIMITNYLAGAGLPVTARST